MVQRLLSAIYRRTGPRYPLTVLAMAFVLQFAVFAEMIAAITLYVHASLGQYVILVLAAGVLQAVFAVTSAPFFAQRLAPTTEWLGGGRVCAGGVLQATDP
jgi:hypothetical protein